MLRNTPYLLSRARVSCFLVTVAFTALSCTEEESNPSADRSRAPSSVAASEVRPPADRRQESRVRDVSIEPDFSVGGTESSILFDVQGAGRLGLRVAVANGGDATLRYFGASGVPLHRVGGRGGGPEEFGNIVWARRCSADPPLLYVYDRGRRRMSIYDSAGVQVDAFRFELPGGRSPYRLTCNDRGSLASVEWAFDANATGAFALPTDIIFTGGDRKHSTIGTFLGPDRFRSGLSGRPLPLGADLHVALGKDRIFIGDARMDSILVFSVDGGLVDALAVPRSERRIPDRDIDDYIEAQLGDAGGSERRNLRAWWHREMVFPEHYPAFSALLVDVLDQLWVRAYPAVNTDSVAWWIFSPNGQQYIEFELPVDLEVYEVGLDYVLGLRTDSLGVERMERYRLTREDRPEG